MANCIYCGKYVNSGYIGMNGNYYKNIMSKQSGKYGRIIAAHKSCYMNNLLSIRRKIDNEDE